MPQIVRSSNTRKVDRSVFNAKTPKVLNTYIPSVSCTIFKNSKPSQMLPEGYTFRPVEKSDHADYVATLSVLTHVGEISAAQFSELLDHWAQNESIYYPRVIADQNNKVVATGMIAVERKLVHGCGKVGHIEDIAVAKDQQGKKLGQHMIQELSKIGHGLGCYKVILDCSEHNVGFYEKCDYKRYGSAMSIRYD